MVKNAGKAIIFILVFVMVFSLFSFTAYSEQSYAFTYYISDETAVLTGIEDIFADAVIIPETLGGYPVSTIDKAFRYRSKITSVSMPDSVTEITADSFSYCLSLQSIKFSSNLSIIGERAFMNCNSLEVVEIPDSVTSIGDYAFSWCEKLESVTMPENILTISKGLFCGCLSLGKVDIPESVTSIGSDAFLKTGYYNDSNNWKNSALYMDEYLLSVKSDISGSYELKRNTKVVADQAFESCNSLESVVFYDGLKAVGDSAFDNCDYLTDVYYSGTLEQRQKILIGDGNSYFIEADWHYGYCLAGDINDDGKVNNKDLIRLFKYLSDWDVVVKENLLDVNGDGSVNNKDMTRLFRYLSGWNVRIYYSSVGGESGGSSGGDEYGPIVVF